MDGPVGFKGTRPDIVREGKHARAHTYIYLFLLFVSPSSVLLGFISLCLFMYPFVLSVYLTLNVTIYLSTYPPILSIFCMSAVAVH